MGYIGACGHDIDKAELADKIDAWITDTSDIIVRVVDEGADSAMPETFCICADCIDSYHLYKMPVQVYLEKGVDVSSELRNFREDYQEVLLSNKVKELETKSKKENTKYSQFNRQAKNRTGWGMQ